jgi:hypothetical protein
MCAVPGAGAKAAPGFKATPGFLLANACGAADWAESPTRAAQAGVAE